MTFDSDVAASVEAELLQVLQEIALANKVRVEEAYRKAGRRGTRESGT